MTLVAVAVWRKSDHATSRSSHNYLHRCLLEPSSSCEVCRCRILCICILYLIQNARLSLSVLATSIVLLLLLLIFICSHSLFGGSWQGASGSPPQLAERCFGECLCLVLVGIQYGDIRVLATPLAVSPGSHVRRSWQIGISM